jgi:hypothetical protein
MRWLAVVAEPFAVIGRHDKQCRTPILFKEVNNPL